MSTILFVGHSHICAIYRAWALDSDKYAGFEALFFHLKKGLIGPGSAALGKDDEIDSPARKKRVAREFSQYAKDADYVVYCISGNEHNNYSLFDVPGVPLEAISAAVAGRITDTYTSWVNHRLLAPFGNAHSLILLPPPPMESEEWIAAHPGPFAQKLGSLPLRNAAERLQVYRKQCEVIRTFAAKLGFPTIELPGIVLSPGGFLAEDCRGTLDPTHGNTEYGQRMLNHIFTVSFNAANCQAAGRPQGSPAVPSPPRHPYVGRPDHAFWKQSISEVAPGDVDPVTSTPFKIMPKDRVATAGSCFAQHISKRLRESGFHFFVTERAEDPEATAESQTRGFYDFSARYGNVYTARQLVQLFDRAFGYFKPLDGVWPRPGGGFCDPFRPRIEPEGFATEKAVLLDRQRHLLAVRRMFRQLDVFIFTLGLTECWVSGLDGAAFPVAPGVVGGTFDPKRYEFLNFGVADVTSDLRSFLRKLKLVNPRARVILTVSPVPLVATAADRHVLTATTYSKAVLRVAAEETSASHDNVYYFPAYEIITGPHAGGAYFGPDRRSVTAQGVDHVMRIFLKRLTAQGSDAAKVATAPLASAASRVFAEMEALGEAACDEEMLER